ncbi:hypothetical protein [Komagataeibacter xylinus]|uniref:hypothetical protein n=1 Tax=Komagataeibacter xylinus TaxID=28448 RepID=UPI001013D4B2|nr:hypothetical protein [Komagataeibacter xylinus]
MSTDSNSQHVTPTRLFVWKSLFGNKGIQFSPEMMAEVQHLCTRLNAGSSLDYPAAVAAKDVRRHRGSKLANHMGKGLICREVIDPAHIHEIDQLLHDVVVASLAEAILNGADIDELMATDETSPPTEPRRVIVGLGTSITTQDVRS